MKAFYEMTKEEIRKERAGKAEYYDYEGHLVKKEWNDTGDLFIYLDIKTINGFLIGPRLILWILKQFD